MSNNLEELKALSAAVQDYTDNEFKEVLREMRIGDPFHVLFSGNPDAKIMVVKECADNVELSWSKRYDTHYGYVMKSPGGNLFKRNVETSGFNPEDDFFYCNIVPFYPYGGHKFDQSTINEFMPTLNSVIEIIKPRMIITLGHTTFCSLVNHQVSQMQFMKFLKEGKVFNLDEILVVPLEDPAVIESVSVAKNRPFFTTLKRLYVLTHDLRNNNGK